MPLEPFELRPGDDRPCYDMAVQTMPRERMREIRERRLRETVARVFTKPVPFFRRKLAAAGVTDPRDITSLDDLRAIPVTVKQELRDSEAEHPPVGDYRGTDVRENVKLGTSTGTTGTPTVCLWTKRDLLIDCEAGARMFWAMGIRPGHVITHAHPSYLYGGGALQTLAYEHLGCLTMHVPPPDDEELAEKGLRMWQRLPPDFPFMGFSTGAFITHAERLGLTPQEVGLDFSRMPNLGGSDGTLGLSTAGAECFAYLGAPCGDRRGSHLAEDYTCVEILDPDGDPVPDGTWGRLVVTTFGRDNFLLRYDLEEVAKTDSSPCGCPQTSVRGWWGGREKDLITVQGRSLLLPEIERTLRTVRALSPLEYQVVRPAGRDAALRIRVERGRSSEEPIEVLADAVRDAFTKLDIVVDPEILPRDTLPRAGYKSTRVVTEP